MVLIDLQKAFDTIDHSILLEKMSCLGFAGKTIAWYTSYLTNRSFIVNVGKEFSSPGVPQGSILGPLLFLLYVNDMPQAVNSELLLYADDTCLIYVGKNIQKIEEQLNSDFTSLCEWFIDNSLAKPSIQRPNSNGVSRRFSKFESFTDQSGAEIKTTASTNR